eukprot:m.172055 g.172055  ORF g.172055 m.172055 type:complete len:187 (-) comp13465_c0_seq1:132-692(-)
MSMKRMLDKLVGTASKATTRSYPKGNSAGGGQATPTAPTSRVTEIKSDPVPTEKPNRRFEDIVSQLALDRKEVPSPHAAAAAAVAQRGGSKAGPADVADPAAQHGERTGPAANSSRKMPQARGGHAMDSLGPMEQPGRLTAEQVEMLLLAPISRDPDAVLHRVSDEAAISQETLRKVLNNFGLPPK